MKQHSATRNLKWLLLSVLVVCGFLVPMSAQKAKAEDVVRAGYANGFNEQFTRGAANWSAGNGRWSIGSGMIRGIGLTGDITSAYFMPAKYQNFDYQVRMKRTGCAACGNGFLLRETTSTGVYFRYTNSGYFYLYSCNTIDCYDWKTATYSTAIIKGGFNVIRVVAINNVYKFYINNILVNQGTASGAYASYNKVGYVGVDFYSDKAAGNYLDVDYAILVKK